MKKFKQMELNTKLLLVFFTSVFLLSLAHFFVYTHLFNTMEQEEAIIAQQQTASAKVRLDAAFAEVQQVYQKAINEDALYFWSDLPMTAYQQTEICNVAGKIYNSGKEIYQWVIIPKQEGQLISKNGVMDWERYFCNLCASDSYPPEFWEALMAQRFSRILLPEAEYICVTNGGVAETRRLTPLVIRSYFTYSYTTVLFLDMDLLCPQEDDYLGQNLYLFSQEGELIYTTDAEPLITAVPQEDRFTDTFGTKFTVQRWVSENNIQCVKLVKTDRSTDIVRRSFTVCLAVAMGALVFIALLVPHSVKTVLSPVNRMLEILRQHSETYQGNIHNACEELEQILLSREQQTAALAQRDATLSEYFLQSRMKNVYVDMQEPPGQPEGNAHILYIQVHYHKRALDGISIPRAELENCLQDMMHSSLARLFDTTMIFQLEPGRFAARVTLAPGKEGIGSRMEQFMQRLREEEEFAWFTVVLSDVLSQEVDLAAVYAQVQEAAQQTLVRCRSQLLTLPVQDTEGAGFRFSRQEEQNLFSLVQQGKLSEAEKAARDLLEAHLEAGISHSRMEMLCVAIVNVASYAMTELAPSAEKIAAASGVYNKLISQCGTGEDYIEAVTDFIRTASPAAGQCKEDPLLNAVEQYLEENYSREFSAEEMAAALWVSRSYLSTYYKSKTGMNLSESIQLFRIQKAVELLKDPDVTIGEIGQRVGIPSSNTFLRHFRKYTGTTPKDYRLKNAK